MAHGSLKTDDFNKILKKCCIPIQWASFDTFKAKIDQWFTPQSKFEYPWELPFPSNSE